MKKSSKSKNKAGAAVRVDPYLEGMMAKLVDRLIGLEKKMDAVIAQTAGKTSGSGNQPKSSQAVQVNLPPRHDRVMYEAICADCNKVCEVPFKPSEDRPVYCKECFAKRKSGGAGKGPIVLTPVALHPKPVIRVIETNTVPKSFVAGWFLAAVKTGDVEPIGPRIIEVPEDLEQFEHRDARSRFIAYVPVGSVEKGQALVTTGGGGKTVQCRICHGPELKGLGPIPGIAGRSPSYIVRQLYDFKSGVRAGIGSALMKPTVANLTVDDMLSLAAYTASLPP